MGIGPVARSTTAQGGTPPFWISKCRHKENFFCWRSWPGPVCPLWPNLPLESSLCSVCGGEGRMMLLQPPPPSAPSHCAPGPLPGFWWTDGSMGGQRAEGERLRMFVVCMRSRGTWFPSSHPAGIVPPPPP